MQVDEEQSEWIMITCVWMYAVYLQLCFLINFIFGDAVYNAYAL